MTHLTSFFKETDSSLGLFYPKHYIIATFPTFEITQQAVHTLRKEGFGDDDALAVPGPEILEFFEEFRANAGLWAGVITMLSRAFGTEQIFADSDVMRAHAGAGFLAIHSPTDMDKSRIQALLEPFKPVAMHYYQSGGVESLV
jgi:hypothetical protein